MVNHAVIVAAALLSPPLAPIAEAAMISYDWTCQRLRSVASEENAELCQLLDAFFIRVECESNKGEAPTNDWALRLNALFVDVSAYVDACEGKSDRHMLASVFNRRHHAKELRKKIQFLEDHMDFHRV